MDTKVTPFSLKKTLNLRGKLFDTSVPKVMGILNTTPDSFYDGGRFVDSSSLSRRIEQMISEGADIIDIGGYSTRPGAPDVALQLEIDRVIPAIENVRSLNSDIPISIDTFRSKVAAVALQSGCDMVNDISGGELDPLMFETVADHNVPYVLMHSRGNPGTMAQKTDYQNLVAEIMTYFVDRSSQLIGLGIQDLLVDPGFGFAKTVDQNYLILKNLGYFKELNIPLLVGLSRKSMIYKTLECTVNEALTGTCILNTIALMNGASILRVHDVKAAHETIKLFKLTYP